MTLIIVNEGCRVKNAKLILDKDTDIYHLVHYDTEIMTINRISENIQETDIRYEVVKALKCSNSSTRAIKQVCEYLGIDMPKLEPFYNFVKYNMSTEIYKKKGEFMETIEN